MKRTFLALCLVLALVVGGVGAAAHTLWDQAGGGGLLRPDPAGGPRRPPRAWRPPSGPSAGPGTTPWAGPPPTSSGT